MPCEVSVKQEATDLEAVKNDGPQIAEFPTSTGIADSSDRKPEEMSADLRPSVETGQLIRLPKDEQFQSLKRRLSEAQSMAGVPMKQEADDDEAKPSKLMKTEKKEPVERQDLSHQLNDLKKISIKSEQVERKFKKEIDFEVNPEKARGSGRDVKPVMKSEMKPEVNREVKCQIKSEARNQMGNKHRGQDGGERGARGII